jgi:hypothetical protein
MSFSFLHPLRAYVDRYMEEGDGVAAVESATFVTPQISSVKPLDDATPAGADEHAGAVA